MKHLTPDNLHAFCRTCVNELQPPMYNIQTMDVLIRKLFLDPLHTASSTQHNQTAEDASFPMFVCYLCRDKLESFLEFHQLCTRSSQIFRDILGKRMWPKQQELTSSTLPSLETSDMTDIVEEEASNEYPQNESQVNCDWLEFDFVAIPKPEVQTQQEDVAKKEELLTPAFSPTSPMREDSVDSSEQNVYDDYMHPYDVQAKTYRKHKEKEENSNCSSEKNLCTTGKVKKKEKLKTTTSSMLKSTAELKQNTSSEEKPKHVCEECGKMYPSLARLTEHQYSHKSLEEYPFHCSECSKAFKHRQTFNAHQLRHAGIKNYQCPYCDEKKTTKSELRTHINSHTKERQWLCPKCPSIFSSAANLRRHDQVVHQGIRRFACCHCDQAFGKQESLKHHIMRHTGEKPHECPECGKRFIQLISMKTHMKTHNKYAS